MVGSVERDANVLEASTGERSSAPPVVVLERVSKRFGAVHALRDVSIDVRPGEFFSILGPSGCGKTTTLRIVGGFEQPDEGRVLLGGSDVAGVPPYRRDVNTVFQQYALFPHMTVFENVAFGPRSRGVDPDETRRRVLAMLDVVRLGGFERRRPRELSGGEQQRVALARALVNRPRALLLDEPLGALDLQLREAMQLELRRIQRTVGIAFVHVTHDQDEALRLSDRIAVMRDGRLEQVAPPADVYARPASAFVARFIGAANLLRGSVEARTAGGLRVAIAGGGCGDALDDGRFAPGDRVLVVVRPERVRTVPAESSAAGRGRVVDTLFEGASVRWVVRTGAGEVHVRAAGPPEPGVEEVGVTWNADDAYLLPDA